MNNPAAQGHSIWQFLLKQVVTVIVVVLLCLLAFHTARRVTNCTIMAGEAMNARVNYAFGLKNIDDKALEKYFTSKMIKSGDLATLKNRYKDFTISGYNDSRSTKWVWSWPGSNTAHVHVTEKVRSITGKATSAEASEDAAISEWENAVYLVTLERIDGKWLVADIELEELLPEETETPAPTVSDSTAPQDTTTVSPATGTD